MATEKVIWIVNQYAGSPYHGMEFRHYYLAKELIKQGATVYIISGSYSHLYQKPPIVQSTFTFENIDGISYCWVKTPTYDKPASIKRFINMGVFMARLFFLPTHKLKRPDAIIVSSPSLFPVVNGNKWKRRFKAKFIFEIRDIWPLTLVELGRTSGKHPIIRMLSWFEKWGYRHADKLVSVLPNAIEHFRKFGVPDTKFAYIPNGIDNAIEHSVPAPFDIRGKFPGKFIIGYAGTVGISNAMEYFIAAAKELGKTDNSIQFVLIGGGGEKEKLQQQASGLGNVTFFPSVKKEEIPAILAQFDCCYIGWHKRELYKYGISANKIFDYMLSAKPVIHSISSFNDPVSESGCGITTEAGNVSDIISAIKKMASLPEEQRREMGMKGREYVLKNHSYSFLASKYLQLINE